MTTRALRDVVIALLVALAVPVLADEHEAMRAAQHELKLVKQRLKEAPKDYDGHRKAAIDYIDKALTEVRLGLAFVKTRPPGAPGAAPSQHDTDDD